MQLYRILAVGLLVSASIPNLRSAETLSVARLFSDHMVLQQGRKTSVWGKATPEATVTVSIGDQKVGGKASENGEWMVTLAPMQTDATGQVMTISSGEQSISLNDVLIGEVWMCSGQSNMGWSLSKSTNGEAAIESSDLPKLRFFTTPTVTAASPQRDHSGGEWMISSPDSSPSFSAVGFYFGRELLEKLDVPIGLINTAWGGKPSEAFTTRGKLEGIDAARDLLAYWDDLQANWNPEAARERYEKALAIFQEKRKQGDKRARRPAAPVEPRLQPNFPSAIYNSRVAPCTPYAIAGAIWYQGESNRTRAVQYESIFPAMIEDWRAQWGYDFPFYFVQLANFMAPSTEPGTPDSWAELQNAQRITLDKVPATGMAIINDIGEADDIHPGNKHDVGLRLARWALANDYGKEISPVSGPLYSSHDVQDGAVVVHFDHVGEGLKSRDGESLNRFEIAGEDRIWFWGDAQINQDGKSVRVTSEDVPEPIAVRYAWAANPIDANLVNSAGLPASIFRTDDWRLSSEGVNSPALSAILRRNEQLKKGGYEVLFNGINTDGWKNPYSYGDVKVVNGEIHLEANKKFFLVTEKKYGDFRLSADIRLPEGKANSGIMFRAHVEPGKVYGYQAECDGSDRRWSGGLYDEGRRGWIWPSKKGRSEEEFLVHEEKSQAHMAQPEIQNALKRNDWNTYTIICQGNQIRIMLNGVTVTNLKDDTDAVGHIGIQHHGEEGAVYRFRNIYLKEL